MSEYPSGAVLSLRTGVDRLIGHTATAGIPLPWLRPRRCTISVISGWPPARLPVDRGEPAASSFHRMPYGRATTPAVAVISRLTAQMKPQSSRAIAVTATVLGLPLRISAR
jgi:hypothetical protein